MEVYLNRGIKEVIDEFPGLEPILDEYGIGCGPCSVGTCLFKDIVEIHNLQPDQEQELMARVAKVITPDAPTLVITWAYHPMVQSCLLD